MNLIGKSTLMILIKLDCFQIHELPENKLTADLGTGAGSEYCYQLLDIKITFSGKIAKKSAFLSCNRDLG